MKIAKKRRGVTIVEISVVLVLSSLFSLLVFQIFRQTNLAQPKVAANLQLQSTILTGMNKMLRSVREGIHFAVPGLNEDAPMLVFVDNQGDFRSIFAIEDEEYSRTYKRKLYRLIQYNTDSKLLNVGYPVHDSDRETVLCRNVVSASFRLSSSQSVTAKILFANESQEFEIMTEVSLMNSGESS